MHCLLQTDKSFPLQIADRIDEVCFQDFFVHFIFCQDGAFDGIDGMGTVALVDEKCSDFVPENPQLKILRFAGMSDEWLDFIAACRAGKSHDYDIVEGPMADDTIWNYVNDFLSGNISRTAFWELARFKHPTHQISFHTMQALLCLQFERGEYIDRARKR